MQSNYQLKKHIQKNSNANSTIWFNCHYVTCKHSRFPYRFLNITTISNNPLYSHWTISITASPTPGVVTGVQETEPFSFSSLWPALWRPPVFLQIHVWLCWRTHASEQEKYWCRNWFSRFATDYWSKKQSTPKTKQTKNPKPPKPSYIHLLPETLSYRRQCFLHIRTVKYRHVPTCWLHLQSVLWLHLHLGFTSLILCLS